MPNVVKGASAMLRSISKRQNGVPGQSWQVGNKRRHDRTGITPETPRVSARTYPAAKDRDSSPS
jgi:hypothetical protein